MKRIYAQIHEYHALVDDLKNEDITLPETFVHLAYIEKYMSYGKIIRKN